MGGRFEAAKGEEKWDIARDNRKAEGEMAPERKGRNREGRCARLEVGRGRWEGRTHLAKK